VIFTPQGNIVAQIGRGSTLEAHSRAEKGNVGIRITQVDAFTNRPFSGNPAAVCILASPAEEAWMRNVAREMNLSETAFLVRQADGYDLRWFTPAVEVDLCGHATLAAAHVLWEEEYLQPQQTACFHTKSGLLTASCSGTWIELDFPAIHSEPAAAPEGLAEALGATPHYVGRNRFDYLVELASAEAVRALTPDFAALKKIPVRAVCVTSRSDSPQYDFVSRVFGPGSGIDEDPVTGSAHCYLATYWQQQLGKREFVAYQASARGGVVRVRLVGDRAILGGQAVTVMRAELL
jgi:PhzF family phenazine biosynthesis protein